jgi:heptosyltransferase-3
MFPLKPTTSGKIAIVHQGALGDFLLALPVLEGLHRSYPLIRIDLWSKPEHIALLAEKPHIGKEHPPRDADLVPFFHDELWRKAKIPRFFQDALAILIFGQTGSRRLAERLSERLPCPVQWIQSFPCAESKRHVSHFLLEQCRRLGWSVEECLPQLTPSPHEGSLIQRLLWQENQTSFRKPVAVHPGSGGLQKIWPLKNWWAMVGSLRRNDRYPVFLTLGPADERLRGFSTEVEKLGVVVLERLSLSGLAAFLSECRLFIGSDSGVSHLAALLRIPTLVIFGPTDPRVWAPRGPNVHIIREGWEESDVLTWSPDLDKASLDGNLLEIMKSLLPDS